MALKIIFMGTPDFAVPILQAIHFSDHKILEVYTQPPTKSGRGQKINYSNIHNYSEKLNLKVRCPTALEASEEIIHIKKLNPDVVVVVAYGKIIPTEMLNIDNILFINVHASLLPRWRGAAPIQRAIMNMDKETGISIMKIVSELDAGPVLLKSKIDIFKDTNYKVLSEKMSKLGGGLILKALELIEKNKANFIEQNESVATYAKKIQKTETKINWNEEAKKIIAKINAFYPNPGCWFYFLGSRIKIVEAIESKNSGKPGFILDSKFTIACSENSIQILKLKREGKKIMKAEDFLRGNKIEIGQKVD